MDLTGQGVAMRTCVVFSRNFNEDGMNVFVGINFDELDIFQFENLYDIIRVGHRDDSFQCGFDRFIVSEIVSYVPFLFFHPNIYYRT
jgi:hypothetical protein